MKNDLAVIKKLRTYTAVTMCTASEYLEANPPKQAIELPESSWGSGGHWQVWLNNDTEWMWPIIHESEKTMEALAKQHASTKDELTTRALKQATRELLLLESSDWPFLVTTGQAKNYAVERFNSHHERFKQLADMLKSGKIDGGKLSEIEDIDNCFPDASAGSFLVPQSAEAVK